MPTSRPLVNATADLTELDAITAPLDLARRIGALARQFGTLRRPLPQRRAEAIRNALKTMTAADVAEELGLSPARISQLANPKLKTTEAAA